jgi:hypothetical protein
MNEERFTPCPFEDDVLTVFLDGEPSNNIPALEDHLAGCPRCKTVLNQSRELDAALASRTQVSLKDSEADHFLSFLPEKPQPSLKSGSFNFLESFPFALLSASILLSLGVYFFAGQGGQNRQSPSPIGSQGKATPVAPKTSSFLAISGPAIPGLSLGIESLNPFAGKLSQKRKKMWNGGFSSGSLLEAVRILRKEMVFFRTPCPMVFLGELGEGIRLIESRSILKTPKVGSEDGVLDWLPRQVGRGHFSVVSLLYQAILDGKKTFRLLVSKKLRSHPSAIIHLRKWLRQRRDCSLQSAALLGAVQDFGAIPLLAQRGVPSLLEAIRSARSVGGARAFPFLLHLWLETQRRNPALAAQLAPSWFEGMETLCFREGYAFFNRRQPKGSGSQRNGIRKLFLSLGASGE